MMGIMLYVVLHLDVYAFLPRFVMDALGCVMEQTKQKNHVLIDPVADFHAVSNAY